MLNTTNALDMRSLASTSPTINGLVWLFVFSNKFLTECKTDKLSYNTVLLDAYTSISYSDRIAGHAIYTKSYLGHVRKKVEKHCIRDLLAT